MIVAEGTAGQLPRPHTGHARRPLVFETSSARAKEVPVLRRNYTPERRAQPARARAEREASRETDNHQPQLMFGTLALEGDAIR